jgi:hypothetical protein
MLESSPAREREKHLENDSSARGYDLLTSISEWLQVIGFSARCGLVPHSITKPAESKQNFAALGAGPAPCGLDGANAPHDYGLTTVASSADRPFHAIWAPMQSRMKAITRRIPWAVVGGMILVILGA